MYADIVSVVAAASAPPAAPVIVDVSVKNVGNSAQPLAVTGVCESNTITFQFDYLQVLPGETVVFRGSCVMPGQNAKITVWSWHWDGVGWILDDQATKDIAVSIETPQVSDFKIADFVKI